MPLKIKNILNEYNTIIVITDIKKYFNYNYKYLGCYTIKIINNKPFVYIYIDENNNLINIKKNLGHEIGHFLDQLLGCFYNKKSIKLQNINDYSLSLTCKNL